MYFLILNNNEINTNIQFTHTKEQTIQEQEHKYVCCAHTFNSHKEANNTRVRVPVHSMCKYIPFTTKGTQQN